MLCEESKDEGPVKASSNSKVQWKYSKRTPWASLGGFATGFLLSCTMPIAAFAAPVNWSDLFADGQRALDQQSLSLAESKFRKAYSLVLKQSKNAADEEQCMLKLAATLALEDKTGEAQALYQKLLHLLTSRYGARSSQVAPVFMALGSLQEAEGDHSSAMKYYQQALSINESHYGPYSPYVAGSLRRMARASKKSGRIKDAETHYQRAISILSKDPNADAASQLENVMHDYGDLLKGNDTSDRDLIKDFQEDIMNSKKPSLSPPEKRIQGGVQSVQTENDKVELRQTITPQTGSQSQFQIASQNQLAASRQAQTDANSAVALRGLIDPTSDKTLAPAYKVLSDSIFKQNRFEKGESYYQRMIAIDIDALGPNHPSVANDLNGLAQLYIAQKRYKEAQPLLIRALPIYDQTYGANNLLTVNTRASLASVELQLGNSDKAAELYRNALAKGPAALGPNSIETARILNNLAYSKYREGNLEEARTFYEWAIASTEGAVGEKDALLAACLRDYAQVLRSLGRVQDATAAESRAARILAEAK